MTSIAQDARLFAELNVNEAKKIHALAEQARNTTMEAYSLAKKTIAKYSNMTDDIRGLENKLELLEHRMSEVKNLTSIAATKSSAVSQEAIDLLILDLALPPVDIEQLRNQVEDVNNEGLRLKEQAQLLLDKNENLINEMVEKVRKSEELIELVQDQQAATAELVAELDKANEKVDDAVKRGDQTLKEAQETLQKLGEFHAEVEKERVKAQDALKDIKNIESLIMDAKEKASQAEKILNGSEYKAESAREIAQDAQTHAEEASAKANTIRTEANKTKIEALRVGNEAEKLHQRVDIIMYTNKVHQIYFF